MYAIRSYYAADTDGDTLSDYDELNLYSTDPTVADTDGDGVYRRGDLVGRSGAPELTVGLFTAPDGFTVAGPPLRVDRRAPRDAGFPVRITSYNVCCTKLLRGNALRLRGKVLGAR